MEMTSDFEWVAEVEEDVPIRFQTAAGFEQMRIFLRKRRIFAKAAQNPAHWLED